MLTLIKSVNFLPIILSYNLLGIAETWLDSAVSDDVIRIPDYKVIRHDRNVNGGGVALFVRDHLRCEVLETSGTE